MTSVDTPIWVKQEPHFLFRSYEIVVDGTKIVVVWYKNVIDDEDFFRFYIVEPNGSPTPFMERIWRQMKNESITDSFPVCKIDDDGRTLMKEPITDESFIRLWRRIVYLYKMWNRFPTVEDFATVEKLEDAYRAIEDLRKEESDKLHENEIRELQSRINDARDKIATLEKELNKIYENAADAMNLFEENGLDPNEPIPPVPKYVLHETAPTYNDLTISSDFSGTYNDLTISSNSQSPITSLPIKFRGHASISLDSCGNLTNVTPLTPLDAAPFTPLSDGDIFIDPSNNHIAVYTGHTNSKWCLIR
jgi:hypothetical protein